MTLSSSSEPVRQPFSATARAIALTITAAGVLAGVGLLLISVPVFSESALFGVVMAAIGMAGVLGGLSFLAVVARGRPVHRGQMAVAATGVAMPVAALGFVTYGTGPSDPNRVIRDALGSDLRSTVEAQVAFYEAQGRFASTYAALQPDWPSFAEVSVEFDDVDSLGFTATARTERTGIVCTIEFRLDRHDTGLAFPEPTCTRGDDRD